MTDGAADAPLLGATDAVPLEDAAAVPVDSSPSWWPSWTMNLSRPTYVQFDVLYWTVTDPKPPYAAYNVYSGSSTSAVTETQQPLDQIRLDDPNTDHEIGLRLFWGRHVADRLAVEWGGLWVKPFDYIGQAFSQPASTNFGVVTPAQTVRIAGPNDPLDFGELSFRNRYWGTEINGRWHLLDNRAWTVDLVGGPRYFNYVERLALAYDRVPGGATPVVQTERFETDNNLIGAHLGGDATLALWEYVSWRYAARFGLLGNIQNVNIKGPAPGDGRFTNASNLGSQDASDISPMFDLSTGMLFHVTPDITFLAGYSGIWLGNILRATEQVDVLGVGGNPIVPLATDDIWIHGFTFSLTARW
jgi:hypothetical protein